MFGFRKHAARLRLATANAKWRACRAERIAAEDRGDTRELHRTRSALIAANHERMEAEIALAALEAPTGAQVAR